MFMSTTLHNDPKMASHTYQVSFSMVSVYTNVSMYEHIYFSMKVSLLLLLMDFLGSQLETVTSTGAGPNKLGIAEHSPGVLSDLQEHLVTSGLTGTKALAAL